MRLSWIENLLELGYCCPDLPRNFTSHLINSYEMEKAATVWSEQEGFLQLFPTRAWSTITTCFHQITAMARHLCFGDRIHLGETSAVHAWFRATLLAFSLGGKMHAALGVSPSQTKIIYSECVVAAAGHLYARPRLDSTSSLETQLCACCPGSCPRSCLSFNLGCRRSVGRCRSVQTYINLCFWVPGLAGEMTASIQGTMNHTLNH